MRTGIALGSNIGDRLLHLQQARNALGAIDGVGEPFHQSRVYETEPVDSEPEAAAFLNAVVEVEFSGMPIMLLDALQTIEKQMGRPSKHPRNSPRTIDLDILYAGNLTLQNDEIVIPHPRLGRRRFVLKPLSDIRPDLILPGQHSAVSDLLKNLAQAPVELFAENW